MKLLTSCLLALTLASGSFALPQSRVPCPHRVKESIEPPRGWKKVAAAHPDHIIHLRIGLPQPNHAELEKHLYEISDPSHPRYGQHFSKAEVDALVAPPKESIDRVDEWLTSFGLGEKDLSRSSAQDWVMVKVPISVAEKMLNTEYHVWTYEDTDEQIIRTTSYGIPEYLDEHIDLIQPTTLFARWSKMRTTSHFEGVSLLDESLRTFLTHTEGAQKSDAVNPSCNTTITIDCLRDLYNFEDYVPQAPQKNAIGITSYLDEFANLHDLKLFYQEQRPEAANSTFEFISVKGGRNDQDVEKAGTEANLDVQFAFGLTWPTRSVAWSTAGSPPFKPDLHTPNNTNEPYLDWLEYALKQDNLPQTISTSYGEEEQTIPPSYARRVCHSIGQLGLRGVSMLFSSGDFGVGDGNSDPDTQICKTNDGRNATRFMPTFPASCPFSTTVGGTTNIPEEAVDFSGGGFSDYWSRPNYQSSAVEKYLQSLPADIYSGMFNRNGRAFPDVAAQGRRFRIYWKGRPMSIGGTSASAPVFAAVVALLNDARIAAGKPSLGFLNPWLYSQGYAGLNDITTGNNPGCGTQGFHATHGWDPVTGLGTPDFAKLMDLALEYSRDDSELEKLTAEQSKDL